jgi:hypothetical protein
VNPRGRKASVPPAEHSAGAPLAPGGLIVHHRNKHDRVKDYDFSTLPAAEPMQRSLAVLFAASCTPSRWSIHSTSGLHWNHLKQFVVFLSQQECPPRDLDELTATLVKRWRMSQPKTATGYNAFIYIARLLRGDARLQSGPVAEELARRVRKPRSGTQSYSEADFDRVKVVARRMFRAAWLRIGENARHLGRWRAGALTEGGRDWVIGEALDILARTGDLPKVTDKNGNRTLTGKYRKAFGGTSAVVTWQRLFLSRMEAIALGVLLMAEYGWNLSVIDQAEVPRASPDPGEDGHPTYRIPLEKARRGTGRQYETRNVTDDGAASRGRLITQALEATRFARAIVEDLAPGTDRLVVWRASKPGRAHSDLDRHPPAGPFHFGVPPDSATGWAKAAGLSGSPFRRGRRTVLAVDRREPAQHTQETHDRRYVLADKRVQDEAVAVIAAGAEDAAGRARKAVLVARVHGEPVPGDAETATADCSGFGNSPYPASDGGCAASFLMCLGCENARIHPGHHPRLVHLHRVLANLRTVLPPPSWEAHWGDTHARLEDLKSKLGDGQWSQVQARVTDADRDLIDLLLTGDLDT